MHWSYDSTKYMAKRTMRELKVLIFGCFWVQEGASFVISQIWILPICNSNLSNIVLSFILCSFPLFIGLCVVRPLTLSLASKQASHEQVRCRCAQDFHLKRKSFRTSYSHCPHKLTYPHIRREGFVWTYYWVVSTHVISMFRSCIDLIENTFLT